MADDLQSLNAQLDQLRKYRFQGIGHTVIDASRIEVAWKSDAEMAAAESALERRIAALTGTAVRTIQIAASKGLD